MDPISLALACITVIQAVCSAGKKVKKLLDDFRNVPHRVKQLSQSLAGWELLLSQASGTFKRLDLVDTDLRAKLECYLSEIEGLVKKANKLVDRHEDAQYLREKEFIRLDDEFGTQERRLGIDNVERKIGDVLTKLNQLKGIFTQPRFNQSLSDLGALAESELQKSRMLPTAPTLADAETGKTPILLPPKGTSSTAKAQYVDSSAQAGTSRANYVDNSTQTEPAACLSRLNSEDQLTSRSHLFKDTDLESPNPAGFPLWVNKVPNPADGSSVSLHKAGLGTCDSSFSNRRWDDETLKSRSKLLKQRLEYLALQLEASKMHWQQRRERERSQDSRPLSPTTPTT